MTENSAVNSFCRSKLDLLKHILRRNLGKQDVLINRIFSLQRWSISFFPPYAKKQSINIEGAAKKCGLSHQEYKSNRKMHANILYFEKQPSLDKQITCCLLKRLFSMETLLLIVYNIHTPPLWLLMPWRTYCLHVYYSYSQNMFFQLSL